MSQALPRVALVVSVAMWGMVFIGVHEALRHVDPFQLVAIRFTMIAVALLLVVVPRHGILRRYDTRDRWTVALSGLLAVPATNVAIVNAQQFLSPPLAALIMTSSPAIASILVGPMLGERLSLRRRAGFVVALAGVAVVIVSGSGEGELVVRNPWGAATALIAATGWALYTILQKRLASRGHPPVQAVSSALVLGALPLVALYPRTLPVTTQVPAPTWGWLVFLAFGGSLVPYLLWSWALNRVEASQAAAYMYLVPVFALLWSATILGLVPSLHSLSGGVVVVVGVALTQQVRSRPLPVPAGSAP